MGSVFLLTRLLLDSDLIYLLLYVIITRIAESY